MNVCSNPELQDLLLLYLEGELSGEKRDEMAAHLAVCEFCLRPSRCLTFVPG